MQEVCLGLMGKKHSKPAPQVEDFLSKKECSHAHRNLGQLLNDCVCRGETITAHDRALWPRWLHHHRMHLRACDGDH